MGPQDVSLLDQIQRMGNKLVGACAAGLQRIAAMVQDQTLLLEAPRKLEDVGVVG